MNRRAVSLTLLLLLSLAGAAIGQRGVAIPQREYEAKGERAGIERWAVKVTGDPDARLIRPRTVFATVEDLRSLARPAGPFPETSRRQPVEISLYWLTGRLRQYKREADLDVHAVIEGASGQTLVVELPAVVDVPAGSPYRAAMVKTRQEFDARFLPTTAWKFVNTPVGVQGVGFWDFLHGQSGMAPNGLELHPVIGMTW